MKPIDLSKFKKGLEKSSMSISVGFRDPKTWIHTGNYGLNYRVSGDFKKGFPLEGKMTLLAGESGTGKSYLASGNIVKWCQDNGVLPIIIDTENALDETWMRNFGIDPEGYIMKISAAMLDDIAKIMSDFISNYKDSYGSMEYDERPKVLFIVDSLGMAITPTESEQFDKGDMKGDMGRKQKQIYSICRNFIASCGSEPIGLLATQHTYVSQDMFNPDAKIAGGSGLEFTPSVIIAMTKRKLKEDEDGNKTTDVKGIKVSAMVRKTRYAQPFQPVNFNIPWDTGMDAYSGLFDLFTESVKVDNHFVLQKEGNQYAYYSLKNGEQVFKKFRKNITNEDYDLIMNDYSEYVSANKVVDTLINEAEMSNED